MKMALLMGGNSTQKTSQKNDLLNHAELPHPTETIKKSPERAV